METLQKMVQLPPQLMTGPNIWANEAYGDAGGQGSPTPGEPASPQSYFQHSPSLPASGLTEFSNVGAMNLNSSSEKTPEYTAMKDLALTHSTSQKKYLGVRVKMPVRELLRKIRLSKGINLSDTKETSVPVNTNKTSGKTGTDKKRPSSEKHCKQTRHDSQAALKSVEDLDMLVEVLQEDLRKNHSGLELQSSASGHRDVSPAFQPRWWEDEGHPRPENSWTSLQILPHFSLPDPCRWLRASGDNCYGLDWRTLLRRQDAYNAFQKKTEGRSWQGNAAVQHPTEGFQGLDLCRLLAGWMVPPEAWKGDAAALCNAGLLKPSTGASVRWEASAVSFFQFQVWHEENWLKSLTVDQLLAPDHNGNRLLHVSVAQGRRARVYALARQLAQLNRIDETDSQHQTALHLAAQKNHYLIVSDLISLGADVHARDTSGKTLLHLCAEKGHLRVLEVLKSCQKNGIQVDVDAADNEGLTPLQSAALARSSLLRDLEKQNLSSEAQKALNLHKDQLLRTIGCLMEMGANPWLQVEKLSSRASGYFANIQNDKELMCFLQMQRLKWQKEILFNRIEAHSVK